MEEWKEYRLCDVANVQTGPFGSQLHNKDYVLKGTPIVTVEHLGSREFTTQNLPCVSDADKERLNRYSLEEGDIVFSRVGSVDRCSFVFSKQSGWLFSGRCLRVRPSKIIQPMFLYYFLQQNEVKQLIRNIAVGATMPSINTKLLSELKVTAPQIITQQKISSILSSLDDKIEVNRRINDNLEQQAQALFKSWFIDFEPFKAQPFVESKLGMIPEGWRVGSIFDVAEIHDKKRRPLSSNERSSMEKIYPYYGATSCMDFVNDYIFDGIYTLIGEDGSVVDEEGFPYIQYVWGKFWVNNHAHILQGKNGFSTEMIHVLLSKTNIRHLITGAVQAKLSQTNMKKILIVIPPSEILDSIRPIIDHFYHMKRINEDESLRLTEIRDALLPRLMSGELKVNDVEL